MGGGGKPAPGPLPPLHLIQTPGPPTPLTETQEIKNTPPCCSSLCSYSSLPLLLLQPQRGPCSPTQHTPQQTLKLGSYGSLACPQTHTTQIMHTQRRPQKQDPAHPATSITYTPPSTARCVLQPRQGPLHISRTMQCSHESIPSARRDEPPPPSTSLCSPLHYKLTSLV